MSKSNLEKLFLMHVKANKWPKPEEQFRFTPGRRFRFDFAYPKWRIGIEIEGGIFMGGAHNRAKGYIKDIEKYNLAVLNGWRIIRIASEKNTLIPEHIEQLRKLLDQQKV